MDEDGDTSGPLTFGPATILTYGPQPPTSTEFELGGVMTAGLESEQELLFVLLWFNDGVDLGDRADTAPPPPVGTVCEITYETRLADTVVYSWNGEPWDGAQTTPVNIVTGLTVLS